MPDDKEKLIEFLYNTEGFLAEITEHPKMLREDMRPLFIKAWHEVLPRFEEARKALAEIDLEELEAVGLTGAQLELKIEGLNEARKEVPWYLRKVLKWTNIILGSLGEAIPGLGAVKEYKECVEESLPENVK